MPTTQTHPHKTFRVGAVVAASLAILMVFLFFIGTEQKVFSKKNDYKVRLGSAAGLAEGNPVQLSGVRVGSVKKIRLPENPASRTVDITIEVDEDYEERIRQDSRARIRKLGLIAADSFIEITPGSPRYRVIPEGATIPSAKGTDVDKILASSEDLVQNFVELSYSLKNVLARIDRGDGLIGRLTTERGSAEIAESFKSTVNRANLILAEVQQGRGVIGRLVYDDEMAADLMTSLRSTANSMESITASIERGDGMVGALLTDPEGKAKVNRLVENMTSASENLAAFSESLKSGEGLIPRLLNDREFGDQSLREFQLLVSRLSETARKLAEGEGTVGRLVSDASIYEAINDVVIGINESKLLRWFIRNRQQKGIETRYKAARANEKRLPQPTDAEVTAGEGDGDGAQPVETTSTPPPKGPHPQP